MRGGLHPNCDGICDYYIPGVVEVLPSDPRRGHALHSVVVFDGRTVTSARRAMVKISETQHKHMCDFIRSKMSSIQPPSPHTTDHHETTPTDHRETTTAIDQLDYPGEHMPETPVEGTSPSPHLQSLQEDQQRHKELLEQHQSDIAALQEQQRQLEERLAAQSTLPSPEQSPQNTTWIASYLPPTDGSDLPDGERVSCCDQGVNTGPWMEDKGLSTDPIMESRGVMTEWSNSEPEDEEPHLTPTPSPLTPSPHTPSHVIPSPHTPSHITPERSPSHRSADATLQSSVLHPDDLAPDPLLGQHVLARWPDDGWYYQGKKRSQD